MNLKLYLEHIIRPNYTFSNLPSGETKGHLKHLTVHLIQASGMVIAGSKTDFCSRYIEDVFKLLGVTQPMGITGICRMHGETGDKVDYKEVAESIKRAALANKRRNSIGYDFRYSI